MPFSIIRDEIARQSADVVVVPANPALKIDGGAGLAVGRVAGLQQLQAACDAIGECKVGSAVATPAFNFPAKKIVHAVGPAWDGSNETQLSLEAAYSSALALARELNAESIVLPLLSSGAQGCPSDVSLHVALSNVRAFLEDTPEVEVRIVVFDALATRASRKAFPGLEQFIDDAYVVAHENLYSWSAQVASAPAPQACPNSSPASGKSAGRRGGGRGLLDRIQARVQERKSQREDRSKGATNSAYPPSPADFSVGSAAPRAAKASRSNLPMGQSAPQASQAPRSSFPVGQSAPHASKASRKDNSAAYELQAFELSSDAPARTLGDLLDELDAPFSTTLLAIIDERGLDDAEVYKRANISRQHFSKIRSNPDYRPTKRTVLALAVALKLDLDKTEDLLRRAGLAFSPASKEDLIVKWFIMHGNYDIFEINEALYAYDQPILG